MYDGTNLNAGQAGTPVANSVIKAVSTWGGATAQVTINGVAGAVGSYDGSFGITSIGIGTGSITFSGKIGPIYIGTRQLSESEQRAITS